MWFFQCLRGLVGHCFYCCFFSRAPCQLKAHYPAAVSPRRIQTCCQRFLSISDVGKCQSRIDMQINIRERIFATMRSQCATSAREVRRQNVFMSTLDYQKEGATLRYRIWKLCVLFCIGGFSPRRLKFPTCTVRTIAFVFLTAPFAFNRELSPRHLRTQNAKRFLNALCGGNASNLAQHFVHNKSVAQLFQHFARLWRA